MLLVDVSQNQVELWVQCEGVFHFAPKCECNLIIRLNKTSDSLLYERREGDRSGWMDTKLSILRH